MHAVSIGTEQITINGHRIALPLPLAALKTIVGGEPVANKTKHNTIFTWHDVGIYAYSADSQAVQAVAFEIKKERTYRFLPKANTSPCSTTSASKKSSNPSPKKVYR